MRAGAGVAARWFLGARPGYRVYVPLDIDLRLSPDTRAPVEARRGLEALRPSLDDAVVDEAVLLVSEIVTNSVRHADLDAQDSIQVRVRGSHSMLHVDVIDPGAGFDPATLPDPNGQGGWGLWLLDRIASRWGVERDDVTRVWFELARPVSQSAPRGM
jgi:anti-sigma regulatory factor (Ser/Thr protein kinase)